MLSSFTIHIIIIIVIFNGYFIIVIATPTTTLTTNTAAAATSIIIISSSSIAITILCTRIDKDVCVRACRRDPVSILNNFVQICVYWHKDTWADTGLW